MKATRETFRTYLVVGLLASASILCTYTLTGLAQTPTVGIDPNSAPPLQKAIHVIHVDDDAPVGGNGTGQFPFNNLADALALARTTSSGVIIKVAPGDYMIESPLVIDRSMVDLHGSSVLFEDAEGWPTGAVAPGTETRIVATGPLGSQPLVDVGRSDGVVIDEVLIRGFVFEGTASSAPEVILRRVQDYTVQDNVFLPLALHGVQSIASSGRVAGNYFSGIDIAAVLAGGYPASPSEVTFTGNRAVHNLNGAVVLNGAPNLIPEPGGKLDAVVRDNDLSNNTSNSFTWGVRIFIIRRDLGTPGDSQSDGNIHALLQDNRLFGNKIGILLDAGFPYRRLGATCDPRIYYGALDLTLKDNTLTDSLVAPALVTFTRGFTALNPATLPQWQYLHGATFTIIDRQGTLANTWIDHPERDPFVGPCPNDTTNEPLANVLRYNGVVIPNGRNF